LAELEVIKGSKLRMVIPPAIISIAGREIHSQRSQSGRIKVVFGVWSLWQRLPATNARFASFRHDGFKADVRDVA